MTQIIGLIALMMIPGMIGSFVGGYVFAISRPKKRRHVPSTPAGPKLYPVVKKKTPKVKSEQDLWNKEQSSRETT